MGGNTILTRGDYSSTIGNIAHTHPCGIPWPSDTDIDNAIDRGIETGKFTIRTIVRTEQEGAQLHMYQPKTLDNLMGLSQMGDEAVRDSEEEIYRMILGEDSP